MPVLFCEHRTWRDFSSESLADFAPVRAEGCQWPYRTSGHFIRSPDPAIAINVDGIARPSALSGLKFDGGRFNQVGAVTH